MPSFHADSAANAAMRAAEDRHQRQVDAVAAHVAGGGRHQLERDRKGRVIGRAGQQVGRHDHRGAELLLALDHLGDQALLVVVAHRRRGHELGAAVRRVAAPTSPSGSTSTCSSGVSGSTMYATPARFACLRQLAALRRGLCVRDEPVDRAVQRDHRRAPAGHQRPCGRCARRGSTIRPSRLLQVQEGDTLHEERREVPSEEPRGVYGCSRT